MVSLSGKVAIVTGGSSGIGRACAIAFAREGASVVVASRREDEGQETVRLIKEAGSDGFFVKTDVAKEADVSTMVGKTVARYGRLDYAVNNAGIEQVPSPLIDQTEETFDQIININLKGVWLSMKYQIRQMLTNGGGAIVNISSAAGLVAIPGIPIYTASKHGVVGLTKAVAVEYAKQGIRVNVVCPGSIQTDMYERFAKGNAQGIEQMKQMHPIGRVGKAEEIANAAIWLCCDGASFVTGQSLGVDGGYTAH